MRTHDLPRGVRAIADVLTMILTDLPEGCLLDGETGDGTTRTEARDEALGRRCAGIRRGFESLNETAHLTAEKEKANE